MEVNEILDYIKKVVKEHEVEIVGCQGALDTLQMDLTKEQKPDIKKLSEVAILKDKMIFHKACKAQLEDLLEVINA